MAGGGLWSFRPLTSQLPSCALCADRLLCTRAIAQASSGGGGGGMGAVKGMAAEGRHGDCDGQGMPPPQPITTPPPQCPALSLHTKPLTTPCPLPKRTLTTTGTPSPSQNPMPPALTMGPSNPPLSSFPFRSNSFAGAAVWARWQVRAAALQPHGRHRQ